MNEKANGLEQLISENQKNVIRIVSRKLSGKSKEDIDDVVQDILLAVVKNYNKDPQSVPFDRFTPYIITIAKYKCMDYLRESYTLKEHLEATPIEELNISDDNTRYESDLENRDQIRRTLSQLSDNDREMILLRFHSGLTEQQVADKLGIPKGTVKSRTSNARKHFIEQYE